MDWTSKNNPFVRQAFDLANYQMQTRKQYIRDLEKNKAINQKRREWKKEVIADFTDWSYGCMALALHRKHGWGARRISRFLEELEIVRAELIDKNMESQQVWDLVRKEIRLDVTVVDGFDWEEE